MGPGLGRPGNCRTKPLLILHHRQLQWGRGGIASEMLPGANSRAGDGRSFNVAGAGSPRKWDGYFAADAAGQDASMGPRQDRLGNTPVRISIAITAPSFNGAEAGSPRK
jgi:hypothetical protein